MNDPDFAIRTRRLSKDLGGRCVLRQIDLEIATGECVALTGVNGAGKTTLLRCLASAIRPTSGELYWFGQPVSHHPRERRRIAMVAHESRLYPSLSLRENLVFAARMCGVRQPRQRAERLLDKMELAHCADSLPTCVSKGMRQRVDVARALVHEPRILLMDEPFAGLDTSGRQWLIETFLDLHDQERTICFVTHDQSITKRLASRCLRLQSGALGETAANDHAELSEARRWERAA
jgi:ABC-type multidrug transport system ATPase subunit